VAAITLENVSKTYGNRVEAVRGINFEAKDGEFVALLGPSGCGKSSTMRMIAGLEEITSGTIYFDGKPVNNLRPRDRKVAMAFETYALYPTLTIYENLAFPLRSAGWAKEQIDAKVQEYAGLLELNRLLDRVPGDLSGGQAQRVGLARALVREPACFLLDEPISHLDTRQRHRMRQIIKRLHLEKGFTMIYVTHDQEEAMAMADRVVVMHEGVIRQIGTPTEIYRDPADEFVAGFVGEPPMNFLEGSPVLDGETWMYRSGERQFPLPDWMQVLGNQLPSKMTMGIRPFDVTVRTDSSIKFDADGNVFVEENLCDYNIVAVDLSDVRFQVVTPSTFTVTRHQPVFLNFDPVYMRFFDKETGKAIIAPRD
jgi:multiple sugar transport system ATP-binding protein